MSSLNIFFQEPLLSKKVVLKARYFMQQISICLARNPFGNKLGAQNGAKMVSYLVRYCLGSNDPRHLATLMTVTFPRAGLPDVRFLSQKAQNLSE